VRVRQETPTAKKQPINKIFLSIRVLKKSTFCVIENPFSFLMSELLCSENEDLKKSNFSDTHESKVLFKLFVQA
jgi:hypothetical protein